jgi:hypothetical protein
VPLYDRWTATSKLFDNGDGTMTAEVYSEPVQVPDPASETGWADVDTSLQPTSDGLEPDQTAAQISFSDGTDDAAPLATVSQDGASVSVGMDGDIPAPTVEGDTATYPEVAPGVDETLQAKAQGYEVNFEVASASDAPATLEVPLALDGLSASLGSDGSLVLTDSSGTVVGGAEPAQMWGSATDPATGEPAVQQPVPTTLVTGPDGPVLVLTPDYSDPALDFPLTIDPAVNLSLSLDTYVRSDTPTSSYGSASTLRSGLYTSGGGIHRTLIAFDRAAIAGTHVLAATLTVHETDSSSCTPSQVDVVEVTSTVTGAPTWNNQPTVGAAYASASAAMGHNGTCPAGDLSLSTGGAGGTSLADLIQLWSDSTTVPAQLELRADNETSTNSGKAFTSSDAGSGGPVLSVTYNSFPDVPSGLYAGEDLGPLELHGVFSDPDGGTGVVEYTIYDDTHDAVLQVSGEEVPSGQDSSYTLTDDDLALIPDGADYTWTARSFDGTDHSGFTDEVAMKKDLCILSEFIDTSRPPTRTIQYSSFSNGELSIPLYMDEYAPGTSTAPGPALFIVHGGGWVQGCRRTDNLEAWTYSKVYGFDVFAIDYRLACLGDEETYSQDVLAMCGWNYQRTDGGLPAGAKDVGDAIAFLKDDPDPEQDFPHWDGTHVAALGTSAGGTVLLTAVALAATASEADRLPDVVATWSAKTEFATFDTTPTDPDPWGSDDTCDHAKPQGLQNCWRGVDHYLDAFDAQGNPTCGFPIDQNSTDVDPDNPTETDCTDDPQSWVDASPRSEWDTATYPEFPAVLIVNGGGTPGEETGENNDPNNYDRAEVVTLEDVLELYQDLVINFGSAAGLCVVDTKIHGAKYEYLPCDDDTENTVFESTDNFITTNWPT